MEIFLYVFFTGCVYASWLWDTKDPLRVKFINICFGFINGWYVTPILIGIAIKQIYDGKIYYETIHRQKHFNSRD